MQLSYKIFKMNIRFLYKLKSSTFLSYSMKCLPITDPEALQCCTSQLHEGGQRSPQDAVSYIRQSYKHQGRWETCKT